MSKEITVKTVVGSDIESVWDKWTNPAHIVGWAFASDDWECPYAENDVSVGGKFMTRMSAKDKSTTFDFEGIYTEVMEGKVIAYTIADGRKVRVLFNEVSGGVEIVETFEMEDQNPEEMQRFGWQSMLENFKTYVEEK